MRSRALLVTFDAWKTLITPREAPAMQYTRLAREHGVNVKEHEVAEGFAKAFRDVYKKYPNYGKNEGLTPEEWWTKIIHDTFSPISLPPALPPALLSHFATRRAYILHTSIPFLLKSLKANNQYDHTVIGLISNSDFRVISVLRSLGVAIKSYPPMKIEDELDGENGTIDFVTLSYDVGVEKPQQRIFEAAFEEAKRKTSGGEGHEWVKVHIGDDMEKDVLAAQGAGWAGVLWDGEAKPGVLLDMILRK